MLPVLFITHMDNHGHMRLNREFLFPVMGFLSSSWCTCNHLHSPGFTDRSQSPRTAINQLQQVWVTHNHYQSLTTNYSEIIYTVPMTSQYLSITRDIFSMISVVLQNLTRQGQSSGTRNAVNRSSSNSNIEEWKIARWEFLMEIYQHQRQSHLYHIYNLQYIIIHLNTWFP